MTSSESTRAHEAAAAQHAAAQGVRCAVLTVSDTRTPETDKSGDLIAELLDEAGMSTVDRALVPDDPPVICKKLQQWLADKAIDAILCTGGTGIARRDTTVEVVRSLLVAELEGFGELFRMLSWDEVGAAAMLSRAVAGLSDSASGGTFIFAMPGSVNAVQTAMTKLIVPQLPHLVWERSR